MFNRSSFLYRFLLAGDESCREKRGRESTVGRVEASKGRAEKGRGCAQTCFIDGERIRMLRFRLPIRKKKKVRLRAFDKETTTLEQHPPFFFNFFFRYLFGCSFEPKIMSVHVLDMQAFSYLFTTGQVTIFAHRNFPSDDLPTIN